MTPATSSSPPTCPFLPLRTDLDLSICIVNWNVCALLRACLLSLPDACRAISYQVIVVDNASTDGSVTLLAREFPQVTLLVNTHNLGFSKANNQALAYASGRSVCFLNPDTVVAPGALTLLVRYLEAHGEVGVVAPQLRYGDGSLQSSRRRFPTLETALVESTPLGWHWPNHAAIRRYHVAEQSADQTQIVDWVNGSCFIVRREALEQTGGLDEDFFMYSEELDWCYRAKQQGWAIHYVPQAIVTHYEARSSEQVSAARHVHFNTSKVLYFRKHHGQLTAEFLRLALLSLFAGQVALEVVKWLIGHKRPLRRARVRAYLQVLCSGLRRTVAQPEGKD